MTRLVDLRTQEADAELIEQANRLAKKLGLTPLAPVDPLENSEWAGAPLKEAVAELIEWACNELDVRTLDVKKRPATKGINSYAAA